jgi:hypothetical protein
MTLKSTWGKEQLKNDSPLGISGDIIIRLADGLPKGQNYKMFIDNWFISYNLICALKEVGILAVGTVRVARLPGCAFKTDHELKRLRRGSYDYRTEAEKNVFTVKWYDNKTVHLISSYRGRNTVKAMKWWSVAQKQHTEVPRAAIVKKYNCFMGGVNLHDICWLPYIEAT